MRIERAKSIITNAIHLLSQYGHCKHELYGERGEFCASGAIMCATSGARVEITGNEIIPLRVAFNDVFTAAHHVLREYDLISEYERSSVPYYNDKSTTTRDDIIRLLNGSYAWLMYNAARLQCHMLPPQSTISVPMLTEVLGEPYVNTRHATCNTDNVTPGEHKVDVMSQHNDNNENDNRDEHTCTELRLSLIAAMLATQHPDIIKSVDIHMTGGSIATMCVITNRSTDKNTNVVTDDRDDNEHKCEYLIGPGYFRGIHWTKPRVTMEEVSIGRATGEYCGHVDSNDMYLEGKCEPTENAVTEFIVNYIRNDMNEG